MVYLLEDINGLVIGIWSDFFYCNFMGCLLDCGLNSMGFLLEFYALVSVMWSNPISEGFLLDFYSFPIGMWSTFHGILIRFFRSAH